MTRCNHNESKLSLLLAAFFVFVALAPASKADAPRAGFTEQSIKGRWGILE
jgi:hypothetical protein